jgi:hypothetical protein
MHTSEGAEVGDFSIVAIEPQAELLAGIVYQSLQLRAERRLCIESLALVLSQLPKQQVLLHVRQPPARVQQASLFAGVQIPQNLPGHIHPL